MLLPNCVVPLVTPFNALGGVDYAALDKLLSWQQEVGIEGFVCFGTTGEGLSLSETEKLDLLEFVLSNVKKSAAVIANTGLASTRESVELTRKCRDKGAHACLAVTPYYCLPSERGCIEHFKAIQSVELPTIIYHNPARTGITHSQETLETLLQMPHVIGIKECSRSIAMIRWLSQAFPHVKVYSGSDGALIEEIKSGASGSIGAIANVIPGKWLELIELALSDVNRAEDKFKKLMPLIRAVYGEVNPQGIKAALSSMGLIENVFRSPLVPVLTSTQDAITAALKSADVFEFVNR